MNAPRDVLCPRCGARLLQNGDAVGTIFPWCKSKGCKRVVKIELK